MDCSFENPLKLLLSDTLLIWLGREHIDAQVNLILVYTIRTNEQLIAAECPNMIYSIKSLQNVPLTFIFESIYLTAPSLPTSVTLDKVLTFLQLSAFSSVKQEDISWVSCGQSKKNIISVVSLINGGFNFRIHSEMSKSKE